MAIKKDPKNQISAAPSPITTDVAAGTAHGKVNKGAEQDAAFQRMMAGITDPDSVEQRKAQDRFVQIDLIGENADDIFGEMLADWAEQNAELLGNDFDPKDPIDVAYSNFKRENPRDAELNHKWEREYDASYSNMMTAVPAGIAGNRVSGTFTPPAYTLDKTKARADLARDIATVSDMYAKEAGISSRDLAKVLGGIATIESRFGVLRRVTGTAYASSAGGALHYLNGTIAGETRQSMSDPRVAARVNTLGVNVANGVSAEEAWTLKEDNILALSLLSRRVVRTLREHPELKDNPVALATRVYQAHNLGDAGANALARGGRFALEALDHKAAANNPMFFRGAGSDQEIQSRYGKFVGAAMAAATPHVDAALMERNRPVTVASLEKPALHL